VVDHVHLHVVPRWGGDTNFMPVLADVKVLPEHLAETRRRLADAWPGG
jgi:ATP adenylyltransferase